MNRRDARSDPQLSLGELFWEAVERAHCAWRSWRASGSRNTPAGRFDSALSRPGGNTMPC